MHHYLAYELRIDSQIALPYPECAEGAPEVTIRAGSGGLLVIAGVARFGIDANEILVDAEPGVDPLLVSHCLHTTAMALLLGRRGCLPIHASAVDTPEGAILFVGPSACGKSTMAAALVAHGYPLISDDFAALQIREGSVWVLPSFPELELRPGVVPLRPSIKKGSVATLPWTDRARPVRAVVLLDRFGPRLQLDSLPEDYAFAELAGHVYRWRQMWALSMPAEPIQEVLTQLVRGAPAYLLRRVRDLTRLGEQLIDAELPQMVPKKARHWSATLPFPHVRFYEPAPSSIAEGTVGFALVTSYPKSGNTWVRALLTAWRLGDKPDLSKLDGVADYRRRWEFEEVLGVSADLFTPDELIRERARLFQNRAAALSGSAPTKVHDRCVRNTAGQLLFPPEACAGVIYVVRNPLDVAVSLQNHMQTVPEHAVDILNQHDNWFCVDPRESDGTVTSQLFPQQVGSWSEHVLSWIDEPTHRCLLVRYEDLLLEPVAQLRRILQFLDIRWDERRGMEAVQNCSFGALQQAERKQGFSEKPADAPRFFRKGATSEWRSGLSRDLARKICHEHADVMRRLGYEKSVVEAQLRF
jgi:aryl sulfotransferase